LGLPPTPRPQASVPPPPCFWGGGEHSLARKGLGESQFRRGAYTVVLFICTYFVGKSIPGLLQRFTNTGSGRPVRQPYVTNRPTSARIFEFLRSPRIDSKESIPPECVACAGIYNQSMVARKLVGTGLSYRPARRHRLAELVPWNRILGSLKV
jgi:hypothetical protein